MAEDKGPVILAVPEFVTVTSPAPPPAPPEPATFNPTTTPVLTIAPTETPPLPPLPPIA